MSKSERLQYVGAKCMQSLALENAHYQGVILKESGAEQLIRLLKQERSSDRVILATVQAMAALCIDIAHVNNEIAQNELCERGALRLLLDLMDRQLAISPSKNEIHRCILIETAYALACLILNREKDEMVDQRINMRSIVELVDTENLVRNRESSLGDIRIVILAFIKDLRLQAGLAISVFAYNNNERQYEMKKAGGISFESYREFFENPTVDPIRLSKACFQVPG